MIRKVILFLTLVGCSIGALDTCKKGGEYCLNHWDCCSNTCQSYLYKCSHINKPQLSLPNRESVVLQSAPAVFAQPSFPSQVSEPGSLNELYEIVFRPLKSGGQTGREINEIESRLGSDESTKEETTDPTTVGPECLEIGSKCFFNEECCTQRCHGFLHQCVT